MLEQASCWRSDNVKSAQQRKPVLARPAQGDRESAPLNALETAGPGVPCALEELPERGRFD